MVNTRKTYSVFDSNGVKIIDNEVIEDVSEKTGISAGHLRRKCATQTTFLNGYTIKNTGTIEEKFKKYLTEKDIQIAHGKYMAGDSLEKLSTEYGVNSHKLKKAFLEHGWKTRDYWQAQELRRKHRENLFKSSSTPLTMYEHTFDRKITDLGKVRALRNAGWTKQQIAEEFISNINEVERCLKSLGMK